MVLERLTQVGKIGLLLSVLGAVIFLVGFSVPYWVMQIHTNEDVHVGLWESCFKSYCRGTTSGSFTFFDRDGPPNWYRGTQALACLALIALISDFVVILLYICGKPKRFLLIAVILDCVTATLAFLAAVVFGSKAEQYRDLQLHFGFAFDIIGGIFLAGSAACFLVEYCRHR